MATEKEPEKLPKAAKPETVAVPKSTWEAIVKKIEMLEQVADKARVMNFLQKNPLTPNARIAKVTKINGKIVKAWASEKNEVYKDMSGHWHEDQFVSVVFEDNSSAKMSLTEFYRMTTEKVDAEIVSKFSTPEGDEMIRLRLPDNREIDLDIKFVN